MGLFSNGSGLERAYNGSLYDNVIIYRIQLFLMSEYLILSLVVMLISMLNVRRLECLDGELIRSCTESVEKFHGLYMGYTWD